VSDLALARERARAESRILFGEVGGLPPPGFDYGNSPVEAAAAPVRGRNGVLFTTNGTAALCAFPGTVVVLAGSLANVNAVASFAARFERVVAVCAGNSGGTRFSLEDFLGAGAIAQALVDTASEADVNDAAAAAIEAVRNGGLNVAQSQHARYTALIGLTHDVAFSAQRDTSTAVPRIVDKGPNWALLVDAARG
jgi:2-phosphosulfolactate phosphatase